ncbi:putative Isoquinoline 1-oxidoreductase subunit [Candidatus Rhodobacter oscarellae]|uniref:Putative Isoquinoline 1-oxidoreductase subunit n=2 Tax=Candidatus Rhodobacter oscarellae TaxID=1675527 RepID=A0A0J9EBE2_9RHOB|nr:putative Isoquinoline 1-oxidoreductase subunit [Candidatus Rhodobacter lobularis]
MACALVAGLLLAPAFAADDETVAYPAAGTVDGATGLEAWSRIYEVASHPRCANCHTGESDVPMWSGPSYGDEPRQHGMRIRAGESRIGAEHLTCSTCHSYSEIPQTVPHAAPRVGASWQLAPAEAHWFGKSSEFICAQLRDLERNDGRDYLALADHIGHDVILHWAWSPGVGREPAPYSLAEHIMDIHLWGAAGQPCPQD